MQLRASLGTLVKLGIKRVKMDVPVNTGYFLVGSGCRGRCDFCSQSYRADGRADKLSRIIWPQIDTDTLKEHSNKLIALERICFQCLDYPGLSQDLTELILYFRNDVGYCGSLSASINPVSLNALIELRNAGLDYISVPLDVPTEKLYRLRKIAGKINNESHGKTADASQKVKTFDSVLDILKESISVFGKSKVTTHLIVGLGESDREMIERLIWLSDRKINVGLFAFTPLAGTPLYDRAPPSIGRYRAIQLSYYLISEKRLNINIFKFQNGKLVGYIEGNIPDKICREIFEEDIFGGVCFRTSGCPECRRPYYNERPGQTPYNYPRSLSSGEIREARKAVFDYFKNTNEVPK